MKNKITNKESGAVQRKNTKNKRSKNNFSARTMSTFFCFFINAYIKL